MSEYQQFVKERNQIDALLQQGFKITKINEDLNGAMLEFSKIDKVTGEKSRENLHIQTAKARKYFSVKILQQQNDNL